MNTDCQVEQILIVSASSQRFELQCAVHDSLGVPVETAANFKEALRAIAGRGFKAVVLDEGLTDLDPANSERFLARCIGELPIFVKLAITGIPRCVQQVRLAMRRFDREQKIATVSALNSFGSQIRDGVTSILLHGQLTLETPGLSHDAIKHITSVIEVSETLRDAVKNIVGEPELSPSYPGEPDAECRS